MNVKRLELVRALGPWAAAAIVVGTMIGTGIFLKPAEMARNAGSVGMVFAAWLIGGALSLFGALSYAELGAALPEAGGEYPYLKRGLGQKWAFLFGWMHSVVGRPSSISSIAAGLLLFWGYLMPAVATPLFTWSISLPFMEKPYDFVFTAAQPLAAGAILMVTFINYFGVRLGGQIQVVLTLIKIAAAGAVIVFGFAMAQGHAANFQPMFPAALGVGTLSGFLAALAAALWAYDGWNNVNLVGSEIVDPQKNIPRALIGGVLMVAAVYILFSAVCFYVLPFTEVADPSHAADQKYVVAAEAVQRFAGSGAATWITLAMVISALGTLNSSILSGARVPYAMAREGVFFRVTAAIHPRFRTPGGALVFQGLLACVLALTGTFEELTNLFIFAAWIFYALTTASVIWLRRREPDLLRPYRTWGYPVVPVLFVLGALALTVNLWIQRPGRSTIGLALIVFGLVFYRRWEKKSQSMTV